MKKTGFTGLCVAILASTLSMATAQESSNRVAAETDWSVFVEQNPTECWIVSAPKETVNMRDGRVVAVRRGDILLFVTHRPSDSILGEVSFTGGYPFADGSTVTLEIDDTTFELFTDGEWAWPATTGDDTKITTSMKRGTQAILTARSARGTVTKDTFSLLGVTAALDEAERRCAS